MCIGAILLLCCTQTMYGIFEVYFTSWMLTVVPALNDFITQLIVVDAPYANSRS